MYVGLLDCSIFEEAGLETFINDWKQRTKLLNFSDLTDAIMFVLSTPPHVHVSYII